MSGIPFAKIFNCKSHNLIIVKVPELMNFISIFLQATTAVFGVLTQEWKDLKIAMPQITKIIPLYYCIKYPYKLFLLNINSLIVTSITLVQPVKKLYLSDMAFKFHF